MKTPDPELLPFIESCLLIQSFFLNILWAVILSGWVISSKKNPKDTFLGSIPGPFHWGLAVLAWAITMGVSLYEFDPIYWFLGFAIANGTFLSILNPAFAMAFSLGMVLLRPWELMPDNSLILQIPKFSQYFGFSWAIFYFCIVDRFSIRMNRVLLCLIGFLVWTFASTIVAPNAPMARIQFNETLVRAFMIFLLIYHLIRDRFGVWVMKSTLVVILACVGLISLVFYYGGYTDGGRIVAFGLFKNSNDIAAVMAMMLPIAAAPFFQKRSDWLQKTGAVLPILISFLVIFHSQSRGAVLSVMMCGVVYALLKIKRKAVLIGSMIGLVLSIQVATSLFDREEGDLEGSSASRQSFWISGIRMAVYNPVFGVGFGGFPENFEKYALEIVGEYGHRTAHSSWILALSETGFLGMIFLVAFYIYGVLVPGYKLFADEPEWLYSGAAYGTAMSFLSHSYVLFPYILAALATTALVSRQPNQAFLLMHKKKASE